MSARSPAALGAPREHSRTVSIADVTLTELCYLSIYSAFITRVLSN